MPCVGLVEVYNSLHCPTGSVLIVRRLYSPKIQLKLKLALTLTLTLTNTGDLRIIEPSDYRADTAPLGLPGSRA